MSKYTTEVRYICEVNAGLTESKGYDDVETIIANSRTKIFDFNYPIYDESYRSVLETKILKHYYTREIGLETVGLWKLKLNTKMNEIMPYYNQLYRSALLEFNPLWTTDYTTSHKKDTDGNSINVGTTDNTTENNLEKNTSNIGNQSSITTENNTRRDKYADTPQGSISDLEDDKYLTNARKITDNDTSNNDTTNVNQTNEKNTGNIKDKGTTTNNNLFKNTEDYLATVQGRQGKDASELLLKYRSTFLNIDMQVINELEELFMHLW